MLFSWMKGRSLTPRAAATISRGAQLALLRCGLLVIAAALLVSSGTMDSSTAVASNPNETPEHQVNIKPLPGLAWIPGSAFIMGTNDKESFPNEQPARLV